MIEADGLSEDHQVSHWSHRFGVSKAELKNAVKGPGSMVKEVEAYLKDNK